MEGKALKGCPIGTQTFEVLREGDMLYIDKTEYIHRMVHSANRYFFLSRPRRFGKIALDFHFENDEESEVYTLGISNSEIRVGLMRSLLENYLGCQTSRQKKPCDRLT